MPFGLLEGALFSSHSEQKHRSAIRNIHGYSTRLQLLHDSLILSPEPFTDPKFCYAEFRLIESRRDTNRMSIAIKTSGGFPSLPFSAMRLGEGFVGDLILRNTKGNSPSLSCYSV